MECYKVAEGKVFFLFCDPTEFLAVVTYHKRLKTLE